jgi:hypothetical protein
MRTKLTTVRTDDSSTLIRMARCGYILDLKLTFSWRFFTWMYEIKTIGL